MALKDIVFGLRLQDGQFKASLAGIQKGMKTLGGERFTELRTGLGNLAKELGKVAAGAAKTAQSVGRVGLGIAKGAVGGIVGSLAGGGLGGAAGAAGGLVGGILGMFGGPVVAAAGAAVGAGIAKAIAGGIEASMGKSLAGARIDEQLKQALGANGQSGAFETVKDTAKKLGTAFNFSGGDTKEGFAVLIRGGMDVATAMKSASLVADVARAKNLSYAEAAQVVAKTYNGEVKGLKELGVFIAQTGDKRLDAVAGINALQTQFGGFAGRVAEKMNPMERVQRVFQGLVKQISDKIVPLVLPFLQQVADFITQIVGSGQLEGWVNSVIGGVGAIKSVFESVFAGIQVYALAAWNWITALPARLGAMFDSGRLGSAIFTFLGGVFTFLVQTAWEALRLLGSLLWTAIIDGVPLLVNFIAKMLVDGLRSALGEKASKWLGLADASKALGDVTKSSGGEFARKSMDAIAAFGGDMKSVAAYSMAPMADIFKGDLGGAEAYAKAQAQMGGGPGFFARTAAAGAAARQQATQQMYGMAGDAQQIGYSRRAAIMGAKKDRGGDLDQEAEDYNAQVQQRRPVRIQISAQQSFNPVMATM